MLGRTLVGEFQLRVSAIGSSPASLSRIRIRKQTCAKAQVVALQEASCLTPECWRPLFCMSLDLLDSQKLTNFLHTQDIRMFEAVLFKLVDTL